MTNEIITSLIIAMAPMVGVDGKVAVAVAMVESNLDVNVQDGKVGEVGLFQIRPEFIKEYTKKQLRDPIINIYIGLTMLKYAQDHCVHRKNLDWLVCYNAGSETAKRIKNPSKFPYVVNVKEKMINIELSSLDRWYE